MPIFAEILLLLVPISEIFDKFGLDQLFMIATALFVAFSVDAYTGIFYFVPIVPRLDFI